jgi:hypothetical protein
MKGLIITYLLTVGGAGAALFNPFIGVCIYWMFDIVRPQYMFGWAGPQVPFSEIVAIATMIGWTFQGFGNWRFGRGRILVLLFFAYCVWGVFSAMGAANGSVALGFLSEQGKRAIMFLIAVTLADSDDRVKKLAWVMAASAGYLGLELNLRYLNGFNEVQAIGYGGMDNNSIAMSFVVCLGPAVFLAVYERRWVPKLLAIGAAVLIGHTVLLTFSRGGLLGLIAAGAVAAYAVPKKPRYVFAIVVALMIGLRLAGGEVRERFFTAFAAQEERDFSSQSRLDLWRDCLLVMQKYPILGAGPDHFPLIAAEFGWPEGKEAHSLWLQMGAELGIPGMLFLVAFYLGTLWRIWPVARSRIDGDPWSQHAAFMVVSSFCGFVLAAQFVTMEGLETPTYIAAIAVATLRLWQPARRSHARLDNLREVAIARTRAAYVPRPAARAQSSL